MPQVKGVANARHHMFWLADESVIPRPPFACGNGLIATQPGVAIVFAGIHTGAVAVSVAVRDTPASHVETATWDEVVETTLLATTGRVLVVSPESTGPNLPALTTAGPGTYRIRVHARGRDTAVDGAVFDPVEEFLIITWPAPSAPDIVYKQTDQYGAAHRLATINTSPGIHPPDERGA